MKKSEVGELVLVLIIGKHVHVKLYVGTVNFAKCGVFKFCSACVVGGSGIKSRDTKVGDWCETSRMFHVAHFKCLLPSLTEFSFSDVVIIYCLNKQHKSHCFQARLKTTIQIILWQFNIQTALWISFYSFACKHSVGTFCLQNEAQLAHDVFVGFFA